MFYNLYTPNKHLKLGIKIWPEMFRELIEGQGFHEKVYHRLN